ncbi:phosphoglycolate phosphatase [Candidatus Velamenicoccus archaeovorus]|uniref:phosphoglycolate phosphatase n=1 Tax=Velamenicoccus archaeovorus TaxID=1930593 RepID=A0A410P2G4_VELA1|nr:HAD family hydrolase [Candidatus Velamenicoccus archaeovorus]QAT16282.1 phosphoglycolate phosphatase [Candidatus Velamenicoccus archaeovorus]
MTRKKIFIFDLDGTLIDAYPAIVKSFNSCMRAEGCPSRPAAVIRRAVGWGDRKLLEPFVPAARLPYVLACYRKRHAVDLKRYVRWMPYARQLLCDLKKRGIRTAVASNRPTRFTRIIIRHLGAGRLFDKILCADKLSSARGRKYYKPHPMILRRILKALRGRRSEAVYVGDMAIDIQTGRRAGISTAAIATGSSSLQELRREKPDYLFASLKALKKSLGHPPSQEAKA